MICASRSPPPQGRFRVRFRFASPLLFVPPRRTRRPNIQRGPRASMTETAQTQQPDATAQPLECSPQGYRSFHTPGTNFESSLLTLQVVGDSDGHFSHHQIQLCLPMLQQPGRQVRTPDRNCQTLGAPHSRVTRNWNLEIIGMADRTALAPIPDQGIERDQPELTETAEILAVSRQSLYRRIRWALSLN
jgi:hypothetical protein